MFPEVLGILESLHMRPAISIATAKDEIEACMRLRRAVFIDEQGVSEAEEFDGQDDGCTHVLAKIHGIPVGSARFRVLDGYAKIQRVCVSPEKRGQGIGAAVIGFVIERVAAGKSAKTVRLSAQSHALDFYRKMGFRAFGDEYLDAGIPHKDMELPLER